MFTNAPHGLKPNDIRADVRSFFDNQAQFAVRNADAIRAIGTMQNEEQGWRAIVHSEARVVATFDEMSKSTANLIRGGDDAGARTGFANTITQGHAGGRLTLSEHGIA